MRNLRIAVWHNLPSGGGKRQLYNHVKGLIKRGHYVESWCPETADQRYLPLGSIIKEHVLPLRETSDLYDHTVRPLFVLKRLLRSMEGHCQACAAQMNEGAFDVLYANGCRFLRTSPIAKYAALPSAIYLNEPYRFFYEAMPELPWIAPQVAFKFGLRLSSIKEWLFKRTTLSGVRLQARAELDYARQFDLILANSIYSRESILRAYNLESKVCYLGIDTDHYRPSGEKKEKYIVGLGTIYHGKGVDRAIRAVAAVPGNRKPPLVWIGNGASEYDLRRYNLLARELSVPFEVRIDVPDEEVISILSRAVAMIYTSRLEPFGLAPLEANACGTPVVGIAEAGIRETIKEGLNGFLASDDNPRVLGELIGRFVDNVRLSEEMGKQAREYVIGSWNMDYCTGNIERYLRGLNTGTCGVDYRALFASGRVPQEILSESDDMKFGIDFYRFEAGRLLIEGWAFIDDGKSANECETFVVVDDGQNPKAFKPEKTVRHDVTDAFGNTVDYDDTGFRLDTRIVSDNRLDVGIAILRSEKLSYQRIKQAGV